MLLFSSLAHDEEGFWVLLFLSGWAIEATTGREEATALAGTCCCCWGRSVMATTGERDGTWEDEATKLTTSRACEASESGSTSLGEQGQDLPSHGNCTKVQSSASTTAGGCIESAGAEQRGVWWQSSRWCSIIISSWRQGGHPGWWWCSCQNLQREPWASRTTLLQSLQVQWCFNSPSSLPTSVSLQRVWISSRCLSSLPLPQERQCPSLHVITQIQRQTTQIKSSRPKTAEIKSSHLQTAQMKSSHLGQPRWRTDNSTSNNTPKNIQSRHLWNTQQTRPVCLQKNYTHPKNTPKFPEFFLIWYNLSPSFLSIVQVIESPFWMRFEKTAV